jgi:hypothetical protein
VNKASTTTTLVSSANPAVSGQSITFTATVAVTAPGSGMPTGTVTFFDGGITLGTGTVDSSGKATYTSSALTVASHTITATYGGDLSRASSTTSTALTQVVNQASTTTTLTSSANPALPNQAITLTATVAAAAPGSGTPTGTVTFRDGTTVLGTGTVNSGQATFTTSTLAAGSHTITAAYGGDTNFAGSTSAGLTQTVGISNDNFANRIALSGTSVSTTGSNVGATSETGEQRIMRNAGGKTVWWTWTAPIAGTVTIDTIGSNFNTVLGVYTGSSVTSLSQVATDNDSGGNLTSKVTFTAVAGRTYQIAVDGYSGATGSIALHINLVPLPPQAPTGILASDGTFSDGVHVSWNASAGATSYQVWRATTNKSSRATLIGTSTTPLFNDTTATPGVTYYYWIRAVNAGGTSGFSSSNSGYR